MVNCAQKFRWGAEGKWEWGGWGMWGTGSRTCEHPAPDVGDKVKQGEAPDLREQGTQTGMGSRDVIVIDWEDGWQQNAAVTTGVFICCWSLNELGLHVRSLYCRCQGRRQTRCESRWNQMGQVSLQSRKHISLKHLKWWAWSCWISGKFEICRKEKIVVGEGECNPHFSSSFYRCKVTLLIMWNFISS